MIQPDQWLPDVWIRWRSAFRQPCLSPSITRFPPFKTSCHQHNTTNYPSPAAHHELLQQHVAPLQDGARFSRSHPYTIKAAFPNRSPCLPSACSRRQCNPSEQYESSPTATSSAHQSAKNHTQQCKLSSTNQLAKSTSKSVPSHESRNQPTRSSSSRNPHSAVQTYIS